MVEHLEHFKVPQAHLQLQHLAQASPKRTVHPSKHFKILRLHNAIQATLSQENKIQHSQLSLPNVTRLQILTIKNLISIVAKT